MRIVDVHTHVFPDELAPAAVRSVGHLGGLTSNYDGTVTGLIASMDRAGIDVSVTVPVATKASQVRTINDWAAGTAGPRIVPFGAMHPDFEDPEAEFSRFASLGLIGFKMHPEFQSFAPDDPRVSPVLDAAEQLGLIAFFHAGRDEGPQTLFGPPDAFARMLDAHPRLIAVLAHMGGYQCWDGVLEHLAGRDIWLETGFTLGHLADDRFVDLARAHGTHRVMFGSDGPWTNPIEELTHLRTLGFTAEELDGILGENASLLLGL